MYKIFSIIASFLLVMVLSFNLNASDFAKEQRWLEQVADFIVDGDVEMLPVGNREIFSIYTEADENPKKRAIIVIHGLGAHPDWEQVVQPIRVEMTQYGWNTLSVQMPVLANGIGGEQYHPLYKEVAPRMDAAIKFLQDKGMKEIVLASHSLGSSMSAYYLAHNPESIVSKFVAVGFGDAKNVAKITIPVLDLYGSDDLPIVLNSVKARANNAMMAGNDAYTQVVVKDAEHFFNGKNEQLIEQINNWLQ